MPQSQCNKHSGRRHVPTTTGFSDTMDIELWNEPKICLLGLSSSQTSNELTRDLTDCNVKSTIYLSIWTQAILNPNTTS